MSRLAPLSQCLHALRGTFERAIGQAQALDRPVLVAASFEIDPLDPLQVFGAWDDRQTPCLYWEQPELAFFAWGCALELQGHGEQRFPGSRKTGNCSAPTPWSRARWRRACAADSASIRAARARNTGKPSPMPA